METDFRVGLALGSGAALGIAHIGVIKALKEAGIPVHLVAGTSMGALVGACYAFDGEIAQVEEIALEANLRKIARLLDPKLAFIGMGMLHGKRVENFLKPIIGDVTIDKCKVPFSAVATDIFTATQVVLSEGSLLKAVRASISIPVVFVPLKYQGRFLVDGGILNPVPADVARSMGATFTIAVNVLNDPRKRRQSGIIGKHEPGKAPGIMNTLVQSIYIMEYEITRSSILKADIIIEPDVSNIEPYAFYRGQEAIAAGYRAAAAVIPEIKRMLARPEPA
jgi:NTE family protein